MGGWRLALFGVVAFACGETSSDQPGDAGAADAPADSQAGGCSPAQQPTLVAEMSPAAGVDFIALDADFVYVAESFGGRISRVPKCGGPLQALFTGLEIPLGLSVRSGTVYFVEQGPTAWQSRLWSGPSHGGARQMLAQDQGSPWTVVADDVAVYWGNTFSAGIHALPIGAKTPIELAWDKTQFAAFTADETHLYFTGKNVARVPKAGGPVEALAPGDVQAWCAAVDDSHLYWTAYTGDVYRVSKAPGGSPSKFGLTGYHRCLAVDDAHVYVADDGFSSGIHRLPKAGGAAEQLHDQAAASVALDDTQVYWSGAGGIWRLQKKAVTR